MLPTLSMAILPIQRKVASGAKVPCWKTLGVVARFLSSYQRMAEPEGLCFGPPVDTEWLTTQDSDAPKLRYARRYIRRSANESSFCRVPGCGMQAPPPQAELKAATAKFVGPASVEFAGAAKSTWNFQTFSELAPKFT